MSSVESIKRGQQQKDFVGADEYEVWESAAEWYADNFNEGD